MYTQSDLRNIYITLALLIIAIGLLSWIVLHGFDRTQQRVIDDRTQELCHEYAKRDHEKEIAPERWKWFLDQGYNPNTDFDWYTSCINHELYPVAGQR